MKQKTHLTNTLLFLYSAHLYVEDILTTTEIDLLQGASCGYFLSIIEGGYPHEADIRKCNKTKHPILKLSREQQANKDIRVFQFQPNEEIRMDGL
mgnify:CR=1 FL=1